MRLVPETSRVEVGWGKVQLLHPFLRGKDGCDSSEFPGQREVSGNGEGRRMERAGGRVKRDTADSRDTGFHTHLNRRRLGTAVPGTGIG